MTPADMDKVREALKPFAKASGLFVCDKTSAMEVIVHPAFTLGELQRASEALALLAEQPRPEAEVDATIHEGCGCVFCDLGLAPINGWHHNSPGTDGTAVRCSRPEPALSKLELETTNHTAKTLASDLGVGTRWQEIAAALLAERASIRKAVWEEAARLFDESASAKREEQARLERASNRGNAEPGDLDQWRELSREQIDREHWAGVLRARAKQEG